MVMGSDILHDFFFLIKIGIHIHGDGGMVLDYNLISTLKVLIKNSNSICTKNHI